ncbi:hypothetical protein V8G54_012978 [Vigna mungo]|uniref:Uncharacterized protein n=1 Tax=Vigna mungo TaxID=3915 RepID=A0AAQ3NVA6_VIGMU
MYRRIPKKITPASTSFMLTPSLDLTSLIRSKEKETSEMLICLVLVSSAADLIGVWSSSIKLLFNKLHPKSERVRRKMEGNLMKGTLVLEIRVLGVWLDGSVKGREALSALSMHERRAPMREKPSPRAWWSLNTKVPMPLLVGYFTM